MNGSTQFGRDLIQEMSEVLAHAEGKDVPGMDRTVSVIFEAGYSPAAPDSLCPARLLLMHISAGRRSQ